MAVALAWTLIGMNWLLLILWHVSDRVHARTIRLQRDLIASFKRGEEQREQVIEHLWPYYRAQHPEAPAQPPHVLVAMRAAAASLERQAEGET